MFKKTFLIFIISSLLVLTAGCGGINTSGAKEAACDFIKNLNEQKWDTVIQMSSGDQLAIFQQLLPILQASKQKTTLQKLEVADVTSSTETGLAYVTVHYIRTVDSPEYGSVTDERDVLLSMKKLDGSWKVFKIDTVNDKAGE